MPYGAILDTATDSVRIPLSFGIMANDTNVSDLYSIREALTTWMPYTNPGSKFAKKLASYYTLNIGWKTDTDTPITIKVTDGFSLYAYQKNKDSTYVILQSATPDTVELKGPINALTSMSKLQTIDYLFLVPTKLGPPPQNIKLVIG